MRDKAASKNNSGQKVTQYRHILDAVSEGYLLMNADALIVEANRAYCRTMGYTHQELQGKSLDEIQSGGPGPGAAALLLRIIEADGMQYEAEHRTQQGQPMKVQVQALVLDGAETRVAAIVTPAAGEPEESRQLFKSLFENNPHSVYYMNLEGEYKGMNSKMLELTGYGRDELLGLNFEQLITDKDLALTRRHFEKAAEGTIQKYEITGITKQGERKPVRVTNFPMVIDGAIVGVFGIAEDITLEKQAQVQLRESEERWHRLVENNPLCVIVTVDNVIKYVNKAGADIFGDGRRDMIEGCSSLEFVHPSCLDIVEERARRLRNRENIEPVELKICDIEGREKDVLIYSIPVRYRGSDAVQSVVHDITERKHRERVIQASLEEKEIMLQEIHHRVKNNMAVVSGLLELQAMNMKDEAVGDLLRESQLRIQTMAMIHEKLYASQSFSSIQFDEYIRDLARTVISSHRKDDKDITVRYELDSLTLNITQSIPCGLILNELLVNCFKHAFKEQQTGTVLIGLKEQEDHILIFVEDNGCGLPADFNIAEQETLGMKLIKTLTRQLEGELHIDEPEGALGSCFKIYIDVESRR